MQIVSVFSGVEGLGLGFERHGHKIVAQCEIDKNAQGVLRHRFPDVPLFPDIKELTADDIHSAMRGPAGPAGGAGVDCVVGGFPCQDLSVAGKRAGLAGERSGLFYEVARVVDELQPRWVVLENVPGLLSSEGGRDMGAVLGTLGDLGYGWSYRVLDAQFFGVAQRRRRVFIVGCRGDALRAAQVLLEPEGGGGDPRKVAAPRTVAAALTSSGVGTCGADDNQARANHLIPQAYSIYPEGGQGADLRATPIDTAPCLTVVHGHDRGTFIAQPVGFSTKNDGGDAAVGISPTLRAMNHDMSHANGGGRVGVAYPVHTVAWRGREDGSQLEVGGEVANCLRAINGGGGRPMVLGDFGHLAVRRLMPVECERLQGFPDEWTRWAVDAKGRTVEQADSNRYRQMGNAVCVNVAEWVAGRLTAADLS